MKALWTLGMTLVLAIALTACGGGGGSNEQTDQGGNPDQTSQPDATDPGTTPDTGTPEPDKGPVTDEGTPPVDPGPVTDTVLPDTTQPDTSCTKQCTDKICGPDGCNGLCGTCPEDKPFCAADGKSCLAACDTIPTTWGPAGVVATLLIPEAAADAEAKCIDFTGDGKGDSGLLAIAKMANPEIKKAIDKGDFGIIFEFQAVTDFSNTASFTLAGLAGEPTAAGATTYLVDKGAYGPDCKALIKFEDASITSGELEVEPSNFVLALPIQDIPLSFTLENAQAGATITKGSADGVDATDGVLAGVLTKDQVNAALAIAEQQCNGTPKPDWCSYIGTAKTFLPLLFDLRQLGGGKYEACGKNSDCQKAGNKPDAASVCVLFTLKAGKVTGVKAD
jgi:hypothetical protein